MHCTKCGAELAPDSKFCVTCGAAVVSEAPVEQPVIPVVAEAPETPIAPEAPVATATPEKEGFKIDVNAVKDQLIETLKPVTNVLKPILAKKSVKIGIVVALVVILAASILSVVLTSGNGYVQLKQQTLLEVIDDEINIVVDNKLIKTKIEAKDSKDYDTSLDGKVTVILTDEEELHVVNGTKVQKVADDVKKYQLSVSGKGIAFMTRDEDDEYYTLNLYNVSNKKTTTISDEVISSSIAIAPDGKSVAFYEKDDEDRVLMFSKGKDAIKISSAETDLYGIANGGKYIFASRTNDEGKTAMYAFNTKGDGTKLGDVDSSSVRFNDKHTQIMFYNDGKTYISTNGKEAVKASSGKLSLLIAPNASSFYDSNATTYPVSNMYNHVFSTTDNDSTSIWVIKKNADKNVKLVSKVSSATLDETAQYLYYIYDKDELRVVKISDGEKATDRYVELADDVDGYMVTSDRKFVYYVSDGSIYSVNGKKGGKSTTVCADGAEDWAMNGKDVLYYVMDDDLYATSNGKKGSKVLSDITSLSSTRTGVVFASNEDTVYVSNGSKKPKKLMDID